ncbi:formate dehydrogenase accessory sulfurtransferase FdhD [Sphingomonas radiodurans]|uniref:formate dehydrogenase accessory sulfurtransferase FdhD n=1 Tax=Sphingomonas radiodurans TaxID=2890321 RepID=UPI001E3DFCD6|nr:formate dehydrogenase accessory sulfurtransferase FdhD [Sphingomonas radiodurans]WBH16187.1 formate dehydrogenase accessory sulfurtransferase FdhD [Sphingomonas radiodurans]
MSNPAAVDQAFRRVAAEGAVTDVTRAIANEMPIAIECNGIAYAVLMASPDAIEDLAYGFALGERLIDGTDDIRGIDLHPVATGIVARLTLARRVADRIGARVRHRSSDASCGLCGVETLDQALRPLPPAARWDGEDDAVFRAYHALCELQPLNAATGAVHGAAACARDGTIGLVREDVGRHNAFDKLIGAMLRSGQGWDGGFALLTSRCSYELVEKAVLAGCPMLATISAPTQLAVTRAAEAGLALRTLVRGDALLAT